MKIVAFPKCYIDDISAGRMSLFAWIDLARQPEVEGLEMKDVFLDIIFGGQRSTVRGCTERYPLQALVKFDQKPNAVELRDIPELAPGPDQVLLEVKAVGACGSDLYVWQESHSWRIKLPLVPGHEFAGVVATVGHQGE